MGIVLAALLGIFAGAHVSIAIGLGLAARGAARMHARGHLAHALVGLFVPPLAPWWAWQAGLRTRTFVWGAALALYAIGVAVSGR